MRDINFATLGVPAVVLGVDTRVIWLSPTTSDVPSGGTVPQRAELMRALAISTADVPQVTRGTIVQAPDPDDLPTGPLRAWKVDSTQQLGNGHVRVFVVPA